MSEELKPCPFCGCQATMLTDAENVRITGSHGAACPFRDVDVIVDSCDAWNTRAELAALKAGQGEAVAMSDVIHHAFSRDRNIGWNASDEEQALREAFDSWLKTFQFSRPNSPWDIWKACAKSIYTAQPATGVIVPGLWQKGSFDYQALFNAIAAATSVKAGKGSVSISVIAFEDAMLAQSQGKTK